MAGIVVLAVKEVRHKRIKQRQCALHSSFPDLLPLKTQFLMNFMHYAKLCEGRHDIFSLVSMTK